MLIQPIKNINNCLLYNILEFGAPSRIRTHISRNRSPMHNPFCHERTFISGNKKAHHLASFLSLVRLTYTSHHYTMNLTDALIKVKYYSLFVCNKSISTMQRSQTTLHIKLCIHACTIFIAHLRPRIPIKITTDNRIHPLIHDFALALHI